VRLILALIASLLISPASAQVKQSGYVTPGHAVMWTTNGVIQDGGTAVNGFLTSLGVVAQGPGICQNSGSPAAGGYNQLCLSVTTTGGGFTWYNYNGATGVPSMTINGTSYPFPFTLPSGGVEGPSSTTIGCGASWGNTVGTLLASACTGGNGVLTLDGAATNSQNTSKTAAQIYQAEYMGSINYDSTRGVMDIESGTSLTNANAFGAYVYDNVAAGSGTTANSGVGYYGNVVSAQTGAAIWGQNIALNDTTGKTGQKLIGTELDFTASAASTLISGLALEIQGSATLSTPPSGFQISVVPGASSNWGYGFVSNDGAAADAIYIGAEATSGDSVASQPINFAYFDSGGSEHALSLVVNGSGKLLFNNGQIAVLNANQTFSGINNFSSTVALTGQYFYQEANLAATYPTSSVNSIALGWNFSNGGGEGDFWDTDTGATDSFRWYQQTGSSAGTLLADLSTGGFNGVAVGATTPEAGHFTTLSTAGALTYGGVTLNNSVTGTGAMVLSTTPTIAGLTITGTLNVNGISGAGSASKYVCVDSSGNMLVQSGAC
jgi:hypothetical protein